MGLTRNKFLSQVRGFLTTYLESVNVYGLKISENKEVPILWGLTLIMIVYFLK